MKRFGFAAVGFTALVGACTTDTSGKPDLTVTISGEGAALTGFSFPPASPNEPAFVDGWDLRFERILVTVDTITLSDGPDKSPTDQSQTGAVVASARGPWAVDMTKPAAVTDIAPRFRPLSQGLGAANETGGGKDPQAQPLTRFAGLSGDTDFDTSRRYAFGFELINATSAAKLTNLDPLAQSDYADMVQKGLSVLYVGTATFKGENCRSSDPSYDYRALPRRVHFRFGFKTPTKYANCQNTDLHGKAFDGEESQRGVQVSGQGGTVAQITLHVDHPFWSTVDHDAAELFFDQMAAAANADGELTLDDLTAFDFTSFKDRSGKAIPWRSCVDGKPVKPGTRRFDSGSVPVDPRAAPGAALRSYADFVSYQQSTQGHLNADGLCAIERQFAAPR